MKNSRTNTFKRIYEQKLEKGFTLIEVLVAISILCFGLLAIAAMQASSIRGNSLAIDVTEGTVWASDQLERLMRIAAGNYDDPSCLLDKNSDGDAGLNETGDDADYKTEKGRYLISWNISPDSALANTKTVNIIVSWRGQFGTKRVSVQYLIPRV